MRGSPAKRSGTAAYLLCVMLFAAFFLNADRVYYALSGKSYAVKLPDDISLHAKGDPQLLHVGHYSPVNNPFEEGKLFRAEFAGGSKVSGNARSRVFLRSAQALYELIENRRPFWAHPTKRAVNFFVSTSGLKKGIYQIGLYFADDKGERFLWTDDFFERVDGGPVEYIARPVSPLLATPSEDLKFSIERLGKDKESLVLQGWAVLEAIEMDHYNAYIKIENSSGGSKTFYTPLYTRMDMASMYDDPRAANSGFRIRLAKGEFAPGKYTIRAIVKHRKTGMTIESVQTEARNL